jgi:hypothetical protein
MAQPAKIGGFPIPGALTKAADEEEQKPTTQTNPQPVKETGIGEVEQFTHDQGLTPALADAVFFLCSENTLQNIDLAIHKLNRHKLLMGW